MLLKTHVEKMSVLATPTIFMKTRDLSRYSHDIHENKGSYAPRSTALNALEGSTLGAGVNPAAAHFRQREQKRILNYTFEAGMCMKTKDRKTQCPNKNRLLVLHFRHLRRIERSFCRKLLLLNDNLSDQFGFSRVPSCTVPPRGAPDTAPLRISAGVGRRMKENCLSAAGPSGNEALPCCPHGTSVLLSSPGFRQTIEDLKDCCTSGF